VDNDTTGNENDKNQIWPFPVAAQKGIYDKKQVPGERVPHPPETAKALFRETLFYHP
jgi:hypothetical protein